MIYNGPIYVKPPITLCPEQIPGTGIKCKQYLPQMSSSGGVLGSKHKLHQPTTPVTVAKWLCLSGGGNDGDAATAILGISVPSVTLAVKSKEETEDVYSIPNDDASKEAITTFSKDVLDELNKMDWEYICINLRKLHKKKGNDFSINYSTVGNNKKLRDKITERIFNYFSLRSTITGAKKESKIARAIKDYKSEKWKMESNLSKVRSEIGKKVRNEIRNRLKNYITMVVRWTIGKRTPRHVRSMAISNKCTYERLVVLVGAFPGILTVRRDLPRIWIGQLRNDPRLQDLLTLMKKSDN